MSNYQNIFTCDCNPKHIFQTIQDFDAHFEQFQHKLYECSSNIKVMDYYKLQDKLSKMTEERNQWRNKYYDELSKNDKLSR